MSTPTDNYDQQTIGGLQYLALKRGIDARALSRAAVIDALRQIEAQSGGTVSPVPRLPKWLRDGRYKRPRFE